MAFTDQFSGQLIAPVNSTYEAITLDEDKTLVWPTEAAQGTDLLVQWVDVTPDTTGRTLTLPDASQGATGFAEIQVNLGADSYTLEDADGGVVQVIGDGEAWLIWLKDNSDSAGEWGVLQIGSTTSEASASILAGLGLTVIGLTLNQSHPVWNVTGNYTIVPTTDRARLLKWTGGSGTISVPSAATLGDNWFTLLSNQGTASFIVDPSGAQTIDGAATKTFAVGESAFIVSDGSNLFTVGYGRNLSFVETYSSIDVSGSADVTLTSSQFSSQGINLFGTLTGNISVIVPAAVHSFIVFNNTSGAFTITVKVAAMTGVQVDQGESSLLFCNGTDVVAGNTSSAIATVLFDNGTVSAPSITFTSDTDTGFFRFAANTIGVAAGGVLSGRFNTAATAVNALTFTPAATGSPAVLGTYSGTDTNVGLTLTPQGTGAITLTNATTVVAALTANNTLAVAGNFAVNSTMFTVAAASGNTVVAGTLGVTGNVAINTNKFNITAASGNTAIAGTLELGANSGTLGTLKLYGSTSGDGTIKVAAAAGTATVFQIPASNGSSGQFLQTNGSGVTSWAAPSTGMVPLQTQAASASASIIFSSTYVTSTYKYYQAEFSHVVPATDNQPLVMEISVDNGANWITTGYIASSIGNTSGSTSPAGASQSSYIPISGGGGISNTAVIGASGFVKLYNPAGAGKMQVMFMSSFLNSGGDAQFTSGGGFYNTSGAINAIRFRHLSGNIATGDFTLYGLSA